MAFGILLYFDPVTQQRITAIQDLLTQRGVPPIPAHLRTRPHISLGLFEGPFPGRLTGQIRRFAQDTAGIGVGFGSIGMFPTQEGVVFLTPIVTNQLLHLHKRLYQEVALSGYETEQSYLPGKWVPHCTLAIRLSAEEIHTAIDICREEQVYMNGQISEIGGIEYPPMQEVGTFKLCPPEAL
jgi:2'-5' RNA ligase